MNLKALKPKWERVFKEMQTLFEDHILISNDDVATLALASAKGLAKMQAFLAATQDIPEDERRDLQAILVELEEMYKTTRTL